MMAVDESKRTLEYAQFGADLTYGPPSPKPRGKESVEQLFPALLSAN